jgi:hypothetical protein
VKRYRLLVDWSVVVRLRDLPASTQRGVYAVFSRLEQVPDFVSEFNVTDDTGRQLDGFIFGNLAFYFWIDFADRHVKVLAFSPADHRSR